MQKPYNFNISLSVLNHLGRNLYRNVITVLGEAISNSWDADAYNVWITIDRDQNNMYIVDDGNGMNSDDFQNKFLKIGYSKRKNDVYRSKLGRPYIGRKGIGKLALLSCAKRIHILSKTEQSDYVGGVIDNSSLDAAITDDLSSQEYKLEPISSDLSQYLQNQSQGTVILFESITKGITNTVDYIQKAVALYFKFSLLDPSFSIHVNGTLIDANSAAEFANSTQFLWTLNDFDDPSFSLMNNLSERTNIKSNMGIKGYIASVNKPSDLKIRGANENVTIDLFVNGRLREKDILRHRRTNRIVENYVYGQIHFDELDSGDSKDIFTSSRESIISGDPVFESFLSELSKIFQKVVDDWDSYRRKYQDDGDPDNTKMTLRDRKAEELFNTVIKEFKGNAHPKSRTAKTLLDNWVSALSRESHFNLSAYTDCFVTENLLRKYIEHTKRPLSQAARNDAERWRNRETDNKNRANISYDIRQFTDDTYYLDMSDLAKLVDRSNSNLASIERSAVEYKPIRDAVGHTAIITQMAKVKLTEVAQNVKYRLQELINQL